MNETQHLLVVLGEECAEVAQRASKAIRFGMAEIQSGQPEDNKRRLERELADLLAVADLLKLNVREEDKAAKLEKLKKYMTYSREIGMLAEKGNDIITPLEKIMDGYRFQGYTDGQARAAAKEIIAEITGDINLQLSEERERCAKIADEQSGGTDECCQEHVCNCPGIAIARKIRQTDKRNNIVHRHECKKCHQTFSCDCVAPELDGFCVPCRGSAGAPS